MTANYEIDVFPPSECPERLFSFRYKIYVEEMHRPQRYANHETKTIRDSLDDTAHHCIAYRNGNVIACIRANLLRNGPVGEYFDFYDLGSLSPEQLMRTSICTRLMIAPEWRRTSVSMNIFKSLYDFGLRENVEFSYMDCNRHLIGFFEKFGYRHLFNKEHVEYGDVSVMRLRLWDYQQLIDMGSPFADAARRRLEEEAGGAARASA